MKLSQLQEARYFKNHPIFDKIDRHIEVNEFMQEEVKDVDYNTVVQMLSQKYGKGEVIDYMTHFTVGNNNVYVNDYGRHGVVVEVERDFSNDPEEVFRP